VHRIRATLSQISQVLSVLVFLCFLIARLAGTESREGRLEVLHNGVWGTICNRNFTDTSAKVACYALGLGYDLLCNH